LPALDARTYAAGDNALGRALASAMRLPRAEHARQEVYRTAITAILGALGGGAMDEDAALALWSLVHTYLPYHIERRDEIGVQWSEEEETMVQQLDRLWIAEIEARGVLRAARRGVCCAPSDPGSKRISPGDSARWRRRWPRASTASSAKTNSTLSEDASPRRRRPINSSHRL